METKQSVDLSELVAGPIPQHVGIIMDGNGRWAQQRGLPRTAGHKEGLVAAKRVVKAARTIGIPFLTLYTFSTENWQRAQDEVKFLMNLLSVYLKKELDFYREHEIRVIHSGNVEGLPEAVVQELVDVMADTKDHEGLTVNLAINYGGRDEISRAANRLVANELADLLSSSTISGGELQERLHRLSSRLSRSELQHYLDHPELPDPDLIIRSGGESRLSNFLVWQSTYAELLFERTLWPDWDEAQFAAAIREFQTRSRRFGG